MRSDYFLGLDLGQTRDFTALAVLERSPPTNAGTAVEKPDYALRHLHRFPLGTPSPAPRTARFMCPRKNW